MYRIEEDTSINITVSKNHITPSLNDAVMLVFPYLLTLITAISMILYYVLHH